MSELKPCPICKGTRICMDGGDNTYHPRCLDCGCTAPFDAWQSRTPASAEVERLVDDLLSVSKQLGQSEARGLYDHIEPAEVAINDLKSRLLAALSNTTPYLSRDVNVPVEEIRPGRYRMSVEVEIGHCGYVVRDTDQSCAGCSQLRIIDPEVVCPFEWLDGAVFRAIEEG